MKVTRQKQMDVNSDTHTIQITLTPTDVKYVFLHIRDLLNNSLGMSYNPVFLEKDLEFSIKKHFAFLGDYADRLVAWSMQAAINNGFILKTSEVGYTINPKIMEMRPGRTPKDVLRLLDD